jgi:uncharacterized membrane protein
LDKELDKAIKGTAINAVRSLIILFLSVGFLGIGMLKLVSLPAIVEHFNIWGFPNWSLYLIGVIELSFALMVFYKPWRRIAAIAIVAFMLGVTGFHIYHTDLSYLIGPSVIILTALILFWIETYNNE